MILSINVLQLIDKLVIFITSLNERKLWQKMSEMLLYR